MSKQSDIIKVSQEAGTIGFTSDWEPFDGGSSPIIYDHAVDGTVASIYVDLAIGYEYFFYGEKLMHDDTVTDRGFFMCLVGSVDTNELIAAGKWGNPTNSFNSDVEFYVMRRIRNTRTSDTFFIESVSHVTISSLLTLPNGATDYNGSRHTLYRFSNPQYLTQVAFAFKYGSPNIVAGKLKGWRRPDRGLNIHES